MRCNLSDKIEIIKIKTTTINMKEARESGWSEVVSSNKKTYFSLLKFIFGRRNGGVLTKIVLLLMNLKDFFLRDLNKDAIFMQKNKTGNFFES